MHVVFALWETHKYFVIKDPQAGRAVTTKQDHKTDEFKFKTVKLVTLKYYIKIKLLLAVRLGSQIWDEDALEGL